MFWKKTPQNNKYNKTTTTKPILVDQKFLENDKIIKVKRPLALSNGT